MAEGREREGRVVAREEACGMREREVEEKEAALFETRAAAEAAAVKDKQVRGEGLVVTGHVLGSGSGVRGQWPEGEGGRDLEP